MLATGGDTRLGGDDFDVRLADVLRAELPDAVREHPQVRVQVLAFAERAKWTLSTADQADVTLGLPDGTQIRRVVTRGEFETLVGPHPLGELLRQLHMPAHMMPQSLHTVVANHEPQLQSAKAPPKRDLPVAIVDH